MTEIRNIRKAVATMANQLRKSGLTLSEAFKKAWRRVKDSMTLRVAGTTYNNGQRKLSYLATFKPDDIEIRLQHETDNEYDSNAVKVWAVIKSLKKYAPIGYLPKSIAAEIASLLDHGCNIATSGKVIGGYEGRENYGYLLNMAF